MQLIHQFFSLLYPSQPFVTIGALIVGMAGVLVYGMLHILVRKFITRAQQLRTSKKRASYRELLSVVARGDEPPQRNWRADELLDLRNMIADMAGELKGESFLRVREYYGELGLEEWDIQQLGDRNTGKRLRAIHRLERLKSILPYDVHLKLLEDRSNVVRLLAMLLYIHNYKHAATPKVISFIDQKRYGRKGYLFFIIQELGRFDRASLSFLFERIYDPEFEEALLISATQSPPPRFDEVIYRKLEKSSAPFVVVWALRALVHYPSPKLFALINVLKTHSFWAIRLEVARMLGHFDPSMVSELVDQLMRDDNYLVRSEATNFATLHPLTNQEALQNAIIDDQHPAHSVVIHLSSMKLVEIKKAG